MMAQENQGTTSATPDSLPVKRKRGRPRKDGTEIGSPRPPKVTPTRAPTVTPVSAPTHVSAPIAVATSDTVQRNQRRRTDPPASGTDDPLVGKAVQGFLDGSFEAGYLLTVRVGETDTVLRGVVFRPGLAVPVSGGNDLVPHLNMVRRVEVPLPVGIPSTQAHGSVSHSAQKNEKPVEIPQQKLNQMPVNQMPIVAPQALPQLQTSHVPTKGLQNNNNDVPKVVTPALQPPEAKSKIAAVEPSLDVNQPIQLSSDGRDGYKDKFDRLPKSPANTNHASLSIPLNSMPGSGDDRDAPKDLDLEHKAPSKEISLNDVPRGEDQAAGATRQLDRGFASMFQAQKVVSQPVASEPITEPTKTLQDQPEMNNATVPKDAAPVKSQSNP